MKNFFSFLTKFNNKKIICFDGGGVRTIASIVFLKKLEAESGKKVAEDKLTEIATRLSAAEATWEMAENLYRQLADQVREHSYDIKDLNREINY